MKRLCFLLLVALLLTACAKQLPTPCAEGHTPGDWVVLLTPTEEAEGLRHRPCSICGVSVESERIERLTDENGPAPSDPEADAPAPSAPSGGHAPSTPSGGQEPSEPTVTAPLAFTLLENGTLGVKSNDNTQTRVEIPATHEGIAVTALLPRAFAEHTALTAVTLPEGITLLGAECFVGCTQLADLTLPTTLTAVGADAFEGCTSLPIRETQNARYFGGVFLGPVQTGVDYFAPISGTTVLADGAFAGCTALESLLLPTSLCGIGSALEGLPNLTALFTDMTATEWAAVTGTLPSSVTVYTLDTWRFVQGRPKPI